ncbi:MAG: phage virion morphogenesis protein, partial [Magnetococcales bacterium]|nr:phage virion morphogenesis protein [Magnetococcales bacterium]
QRPFRQPSTSTCPEPALKGSTLHRRKKKGKGDGKKLQVTGQLASSISAQHGADYAVVGTNLVYAAHQHFGSKPEWPWNIPARPFMGVSDEGMTAILTAIQVHLRKTL